MVTSSDALDSGLTPAQPVDPTILRASKRAKRALELQVTHCDLGQAPSLAFSSHVKRPHNQTRRSRLKREGGSHGSLATGQSSRAD